MRYQCKAKTDFCKTANLVSTGGYLLFCRETLFALLQGEVVAVKAIFS